MFGRLRSIARRVFRRRLVEQELDAEVASYVDHLTAEKVAAGMSPAAARRAAVLETQGIESTKEAVRDVRAGSWIELALRDVRHAARGLLRTPGFTALALVTLVIGIGGNTLIFSLIDALILKPLPYPGAERLVAVMESGLTDSERGFQLAGPNYLDLERRSRTLERMALYEYLSFNLSGTKEPETVPGLRATSGLFTVLGVPPIRGRGLLPSDDQPGSPPVVVLSHGIWRRRFGSDSALIGQSIRINQQPYTVVGVMPPKFGFPSPGDWIWTSIGLNANDRERSSHSFWVAARLASDVTLADAKAELHRIGDQLRSEYPKDNEGETFTVMPLSEMFTSDLRSILTTLVVAVGLVLLIACANVASLLLARGAARRRELAVRIAIGGSRSRIVAQLVVEGVLLAMVGALVSLGISAAVLSRLGTLLPRRMIPFRDLDSAALSLRIFGFATLVALGVGVLASLVPALTVLPSGPAEVLKESDSKGSTGRGGRRLRGVLIGTEVALALVILTATGLLIASIRRVLAVDPGFDPVGVATYPLTVPQPDFYGPAIRRDLCDAITREARVVPGVQQVGAASMLPLTGNATRSFTVDGRGDPGENLPGAGYGVSCPGYFAAMGIRIEEGRDFTSADAATAPGVAIVNRALATKYFPNEDPVGRRIRPGRFGSSEPVLTIVAVTADVRHLGLGDVPVPYLYRPYPQAAWPVLNVVVKGPEGAAARESVRKALERVEPDQPVGQPWLMTDVVERSLGYRRFPMQLFTAFALMAMALAAAGIFGVASESVAQRTRELGIRKAIGAAPSALYALVVRQMMRPVLIGLAAGSVAATAVARLLSTMLYQVTTTDPATYASAAAVLVLVALAAVFAPALRAAKLDPMTALRQQ